MGTRRDPVELNPSRGAMQANDTITIDARFCGPAHSGNGGYVAGRLAALVGGQVTVRLLAPPPLGRSLAVQRDQGRASLLDGDRTLAEAWHSDLPLQSPGAPTLEAATEASSRFVGFQRHDFPRCFVCGTARESGDGLRIFAGALAERQGVAAVWTVARSLAVDGRVESAFIWAALDCPSAFALRPPPPDRTLVLGELTARIDREVQPGEKYVVCGWPIGVEGRKHHSGSAIFDTHGSRIALARATWIDVDRSAFPE